MELTEKEFEEFINARIKKAKKINDVQTLEQHLRLLQYYEKVKKSGMIAKIYLNENGDLYIIPFTKEELKIYEKKYRESGIW